ncbi:hypothetical protein GSI_12105 [Ganoderma sinense ZZ0214-1]|uniref:F-box domain-containing protein n=1 Tax=Ganoderma sinense ZZ0214-1 TaxID=1077348 RepID=A0A2G8RXV2_9APHY|nr:hypothetical protein GSI_12105 [Ganoderma sinense ZZ0214-1]
MKSLPSELLVLIVDNLERKDQKTCRLLSKPLHDLSTRALFSHVKVYFGLWMVYSRISQSSETVADLKRKNNITWEILQHISLSPKFATVVKEITVFAHLTVAGHRLGEDIFHVRTLIAALHALPNLRAFRWHGHSPKLSQDVLAALAQSSGSSLKQITAANVRCLSAFNRLEELHTVDGDFYSGVPPEDERARALQMAIDGTVHTMRRLAVVGDAIWRCSIQSMANLQELEVVLPRTAEGLGLVFEHCRSLRSLTMFTRARDEFLSALQGNPNALPDLRALKFIYWSNQDVFGGHHAQSLAGFIENKRSLVSLDVEIRGQGYEACDKPLLEAIARLPHLEILGFTLVRSAWAPGDIQFFRERLPQRLRALRLSVCLDQAGNVVFPREWCDLIKSLPSLRYLHVFDRLGTSDLHPQFLLYPPPSLDLFGFGAFLRWIIRIRSDGQGLHRWKYSPCWPLPKVKFRSAEDFGCAGWEWLLRWYDDDLTPRLFDWSHVHRVMLHE